MMCTQKMSAVYS